MKNNLSLLAIGACLAFGACENTNKIPAESTADTAVVKENRPNTDTIVDPMGDDWGNVDLVNLPEVKLPEINLPDVKDFSLRGNDQLTAYSLGENVLFDTDKSEIRSQAGESLKQVVASIKQHYPDGRVRIYGYADSTDTKANNRELSQQRAEAVKQWFVQNGGMTGTSISIHPMGESRPVASNATEKGRQQNRRVEIVARK